MSKILTISICLLGLSLFFSVADAAQTRSVGIVGKPGSTIVKKPDGSKEVIYPNGKHEFFNANGTPQGINRTCSSGPGNIVNCHNWGPNSYGGR
jgi:hypothetical protein